MNTTPTFDADGYPAIDTIMAIETCAYQDARACLDLIRAAWHWPEMTTTMLSESERDLIHADPEEQFVRFATGGWSGNEELLMALRRNASVWALTWRLSTRGGLHIYQYPPAA